tara:strand:+ start:1963 stop:2658 length:696 start_codon:yes stop_codon:yes gene_type:complete
MDIRENENTSIKIININPEPIGIITLPRNKHLKYKKEIKKIWKTASEELIQQFEHEKNTKHICNTSDQHFFKSFPQLNELQSIIKESVVSYLKIIGYLTEEIIINSAWLNNAEKNATLDFHYHENSFISGNYFVNFDPSKHSLLSFINDRIPYARNPDFPVMTIPYNIEEPTIYNTTLVNVNAIEGQILLWRSNNKHGYRLKNKAIDRLTLSFNTLPTILDNGSYKFSISQ